MEGVVYELVGSTLTVKGDLYFPVDMQFMTHGNAMTTDAKRRGLKDICMDLRQVTIMASQYIGVLAAIASQMRAQEGQLTVRAKGRVGELIAECGLNLVLNLVTD